MGRMFVCSTDSTYDLFVEDMNRYTATPLKGVHCRRNAGNRERFARAIKNMARDYREKWMEHSAGLYDAAYGWIGDGFREYMFDHGFREMYEEAYGQRPYLDAWFYVNALGLPSVEDTPRTFCSAPVKDAVERAKEMRSC